MLLHATLCLPTDSPPPSSNTACLWAMRHSQECCLGYRIFLSSPIWFYSVQPDLEFCSDYLRLRFLSASRWQSRRANSFHCQPPSASRAPQFVCPLTARFPIQKVRERKETKMKLRGNDKPVNEPLFTRLNGNRRLSIFTSIFFSSFRSFFAPHRHTDTVSLPISHPHRVRNRLYN